MVYLILSYVIRIWEDDHEVQFKDGAASHIRYNVEDDVFCNEDDAVGDAKQYLVEQNATPTGDKFVDVAVCFTMTATHYYDAYNGEHDVKYECLSSDIIIYADWEDQNNETFQLL